MPPTTRPDPDELEQVYDRWYDTPGAAHWEGAPGKAVVLEGLRRLCDRRRSLRVLDVGCGTGSFLHRVRTEVSAHWQLHGIDLSGVAVAEGRRAHPDFHLVQGDATRPDRPAGSFDAVTCYGSWEHFPEPAAAIAAASRLLAPGGRVLAMIPALGEHRTDRDDEGWYEDTEVAGSDTRQLQWNLRRETWAKMFHEAGVHLLDDALAASCGAHKPGVFFFGIRAATDGAAETGTGAETASDVPAVARGFTDLARLADRMAASMGPAVTAAAELMASCLLAGGKILACGNGGSAADAQHFVAELIGRLKDERRPWPAISLCVDPSVMTALANDYGYDQVFARQVEGLGHAGDVLLAISTSGASPNVLAALDLAAQKDLTTVALLGDRSLPSPHESDITLRITHPDAQRVQEGHTAVLHALCAAIERRMAQPTPRGEQPR